MTRRSDEDEDGGLDSLLDTMTNVVGILVIVLVVTQLGVGDAVQRIADSDQVDPAALDRVKDELASVQDQRKDIDQELEDIKPVDAAEQARRLAMLEQQLAMSRQRLNQTKKEKNEFALKIETDRKKATDAEKKLAAIKKDQEELKEELDTSLAKKASLEAILDDTPPRETLPARVVTIPNPRPAPEGAEQVTFVCANNLVYPLNVKQFQDTAQKRAAFVVQSKRLDRNPATGIDPQAFMKEFNDLRPIQDDFFRAEMQVAGGRFPRLVFTPRENAGVTEQELLGARSRFNRLLEQVDKSKFYARFFVLPDSYDIYITARSRIAQADMLAGWEPQGESWRFSTGLGGPLRLGPPVKPNPNAPKPPPAKPPNVID